MTLVNLNTWFLPVYDIKQILPEKLFEYSGFIEELSAELSPWYPGFDDWLRKTLLEQTPKPVCNVYFQKGEVAGLVLWKFRERSHRAKLCTVYVSKAARGNNVGGKLLAVCLYQWLQHQIDLVEVTTAKPDMVAYLERYGFSHSYTAHDRYERSEPMNSNEVVLFKLIDQNCLSNQTFFYPLESQKAWYALPIQPDWMVKFALAFGNDCRAYFSRPWCISDSLIGSPLMFYVSAPVMSGVAWGKIKSREIDKPEVLHQKYGELGVLELSDIKDLADDKGRVQVIIFQDLCLTEPKPLQQLIDDGVLKGVPQHMQALYNYPAARIIGAA